MMLRLTKITCCVAMLAFATSANAAILTWNGGGDANDFSDLANWTGTPTGGTISTIALVDDYIVDDATFNMASAVRLNFIDDLGGNDGSLTFDQGTLETNGTQGMGLLEAVDTFGTINLNSGSITTQFLAELNVSLGGTGVLALKGGGNPINVSTIDFTSTTATLNLLNENLANAQGHLSKITVFGQPAVEGVNILITDNGSSTVLTAIVPEPGTFALAGLAVVGLVAVRRRRS